MQRTPQHGSWLALAASTLSLATVAAACGPTPGSSVAPQPPAAPATTAEPATEPTAEPTADQPAAGAAEHAARKGSTRIRQSSLVAEIAKAGIDLKKAKPLAQMSSAEKKKLMPFFTQALGFKDCTGCHAPSEGEHPIDPTKITDDMKIATAMWDNFIVNLRDDKNEAIFCDTCHGGDEHVLDRSDKDALIQFMTDDYEGKLSRADGNDNSCSTCHGDPFEGHIFSKLWGIEH